MAQSISNVILVLLILSHAPLLLGAKRLLLAVGIDHYDDRYWGSLRYASKDAEDLGRALEPEFKDGMILTSAREPDQRLTRFKLRQAFAALNAANLAEDDVVIVYLSGHGTVGKTLEQGRTSLEKFLVTTDTDAQDPQSTGVSHKELLDFFEGLKSRRKVLILDSCYSGGGKSKLTREILRHLAHQKGDVADDIRKSAIEGSLILSASAWSEEAIESPALQNSLYTYHLIQGFQADMNQDGAVSITEAHSHASRKVIEESEGRQHPTARMEIVGRDPILIKGKARPGKPLIFSYDQLMQKLKVELNGTPLGELTKGGAVVPAGTHWLTIKNQADQVIYEKEIHVEEGREYSLTRLLEYDPQYALRVGPALTWLNGSRLRDRLGSQPLQGLSLRFRKEHVFNALTLGVEAFSADDKRMIHSRELQVKQTLSWREAGIKLGRFWKGADFRQNGFRMDPDYFVAVSAGPHFVWIERKVHDEGYVKPHQVLRVPALAGSVEAGWEKTDANLQASLGYEIEAARVDATGDFPDIWLWSRLTLTGGWVF